MFKKIISQPAYISRMTIQSWINEFFDFVKNNSMPIISDFSKILSLEFSDDEVPLPYGMKTLDDAKKEIVKKYRLSKEIQARIRNAQTVGELIDLSGRLAHENLGNDCNYNIWEDIENILKNAINTESKYGSYFAGKYIDAEKKIILYKKIIEKDVSARKTLENSYNEVFIHEFFHAYHYALAYSKSAEEINRRKDYTAKVVKESLAAYFEYNYCKSKGIITSIDYDWNNNFPSKYPYAGAKYFSDWKIFNNILNISILDMDDSLRKLLPSFDFYDIKNSTKEFAVSHPAKHVPRNAKVFKVCQKESFAEESSKGYLFAADDNRGEHQNLKEVCKGDLLLHIFDSKLYAVGIAACDCYYSTNSHKSGKAGNYVDEIYEVLPQPVDLSMFKINSDYPIGRNERYIKEFNNKKYIGLFIDEALRLYPDITILKAIKAFL